MRLKGKHVVVTGGTGIIGTAIVGGLVAAGAHVSTFSRRGARRGTPDGDPRPGEEPEPVEARRGDVTDPATLDFSDADVVVHGAAFVGFGLTLAKEAVMMRTNVEGTRNVLDAAARDDVDKVLHISSVAAIGRTGGVARDEEWVWERKPSFHSAYEKSKYQAHKLALSRDDVQVAAIMPSIVLGLADTSSGLILKRHFQGRFRASVRHPGALAWVHAQDIAQGARLALEKGKGAYVLSEAEMTLPELFARVEDVTGFPAPRPQLPFWMLRAGAAVAEPLAHLARRRSNVNRDFVRSMREGTAYDASRAKRELGWQPDMDRHIRDDAQAMGALRAD